MLQRCFCLLLLLLPVWANAQHTHIHGIITDKEGDTLIGAYVKIVGSVVGDVSNIYGAYKVDVPTGKVRMLVSYVGYQDFDTTFSVALETTDLELDVTLQPATFSGPEVVVFGRRATGQAQALKIQRTSPTQVSVVHAELFNKYPDVSLAETVQRIPGVTISRRQGEAEFVQIRGIPEQLTTISLNGQRLPSLRAESDRASSLDLIQTNLVEEVYVQKSRTADMDADAIGGSIDFRLRQPQEKIEALLQGGLGTNFQDSPLRRINRGVQQLSGFLNAELSEEKVFFLAGGSYFRNGRNTDEQLVQYVDPGLGRPETEVDWYRPTNTDRIAEKIGFIGAIELRPSIYNRLRLSYNFSRSLDEFVSRSLELSPSLDEQWKETGNWTEQRDINLVTLDVENRFNQLTLAYHLSLARSRETIDERLLFRSQGAGAIEVFNTPPAITFDAVNGQMSLRTGTGEALGLSENIAIGGADLSYFLDEQRNNYLKGGLRYRIKDRTFGFNRLIEFTEPITASSSLFSYQGITTQDPEFATTGINFSEEINGDLLGEGADYTSEEEVIGGYLLYYQQWSPRLNTSVGLRFEGTEIEFNRLTDVIDSSEFDYSNLFPSININYKFAPKRQLRLSYHEAIGRPSYAQVGNFTQRLSANRAALVGNAELRQTISHNFDVVYERYDDKDGVLTIGAYAKLLDNPFVREAAFFTQTFDQQQLFVQTITNAEQASLIGLELSFYQNLAFISPDLRFVSLNATYNLNRSRVRSDDPDQDGLPLVGSPEQSANFSIVYDNPNQRLSAVVAANFRGRTLTELLYGRPVYRRNIFTVDVSTDVELFKNISVYGRLNNLTNPIIKQFVELEGEDPLFFRSEQYGGWGVLGLRWRM